MIRVFFCVASLLASGLPLAVSAMATESAPAVITDERLKTHAVALGMPFECGDAYAATRALAVDRNPSVDTLHTVVKADILCLQSRWGSGETHNLALLSAAAAALLAAHHETGSAAHNDRVLAMRFAGAIAGLEIGGGGVDFVADSKHRMTATNSPRAQGAIASDYLSDAQVVRDQAIVELRAEIAAKAAAGGSGSEAAPAPSPLPKTGAPPSAAPSAAPHETRECVSAAGTHLV